MSLAAARRLHSLAHAAHHTRATWIPSNLARVVTAGGGSHPLGTADCVRLHQKGDAYSSLVLGVRRGPLKVGT
jgi:putative effector of murein hydrolase